MFGFFRKKTPGYLQEMQRKNEGWSVPAPSKFSAIFPALPEAFPRGSVLFLEVSRIDRTLYEFLEDHELDSVKKTKAKSSWPLPARFYLPLKAETMQELSRLAKEREAHRFCDHMYVVRDHEMLLEAQEFGMRGGDLAMTVSHRVSERKIRRFANNLGSRYSRGKHFVTSENV